MKAALVCDEHPDLEEKTAKLFESINDSNAEDVLRSEEHTSELQSLVNLVCRLLLEKKKKQ